MYGQEIVHARNGILCCVADSLILDIVAAQK